MGLLFDYSLLTRLFISSTERFDKKESILQHASYCLSSRQSLWSFKYEIETSSGKVDRPFAKFSIFFFFSCWYVA